MKDKYRQILVHAIGGISILSLAFIPLLQGKTKTVFNPMATRELLGYGLLVIIFYLNYFVLVPKLYFQKKYLIYVLVIGAIFVSFKNLPQYISSPFVSSHRPPPPNSASAFERNPPMPPPTNRPPQDDIFIDVSQKIFPFIATILFSLMLRVSDRWQKTEAQKNTAELAYLKAQINPHFLFNSLNSIYSLAILKSDETPTAIVKLSGMMRYVLSEAAYDFVPLAKEIMYIQNYIDLQKIRFSTSINLEFAVQGDTKGKRIAPLMLIPFIENAFKHGVNAEEDSVINIQIDILENDLKLWVFNKKVTVYISEENKSGLGVENTRNRLELLYPKKHTLAIYDSQDDYLVELSIALT